MQRFIVYVDYEICAESAEEAADLVMTNPLSYSPSVSEVLHVGECEEEDKALLAEPPAVT
jgi:hypothetical protein